MKNYWKCIPVIIILLAGCASGKLLMKLDPSLETNARVYEVKFSDTWSEKWRNISFGPYRVTDADTGWIITKKTSETELYWLNMLLGMNSPDATRSKVSQSSNYKFKIGNDTAWDAKCILFTDEREVNEKNVSTAEIFSERSREDREVEGENEDSVEILSSNYTCRYTRADNEPWFLTIERRGESRLEITMKNKDKLFKAHASKGVYVMSDGRPYTALTPTDTGYNWTHDGKNIAAVSIREEIPRVWLDKRNSESINQLLSMASAGLLIYYWKIIPTLKR
jgi:hypothetical protein